MLWLVYYLRQTCLLWGTCSLCNHFYLNNPKDKLEMNVTLKCSVILIIACFLIDTVGSPDSSTRTAYVDLQETAGPSKKRKLSPEDRKKAKRVKAQEWRDKKKENEVAVMTKMVKLEDENMKLKKENEDNAAKIKELEETIEELQSVAAEKEKLEKDNEKLRSEIEKASKFVDAEEKSKKENEDVRVNSTISEDMADPQSCMNNSNTDSLPADLLDLDTDSLPPTIGLMKQMEKRLLGKLDHLLMEVKHPSQALLVARDNAMHFSKFTNIIDTDLD